MSRSKLEPTTPSSPTRPYQPGPSGIHDGRNPDGVPPEAGLLCWNEDDRVTFTNARLTELFDSGHEDLLHRTWQSLFEGIAGASGHPRVGEVREARMLRRDGSHLPVLLLGAYGIAGAGGMMLVLDRSESVHDHGAIAECDHRIAQLELLSHLGTARWDLHEDRADVSEEMARLFGLPADRRRVSVGQLLERVDPLDRDLVLRSIEEARLEGCSPIFKIRARGPQDEIRHLSLQGEMIRDAAGGPIAILSMAHDVTDLTLARQAVLRGERRLAEAEQMANVGSWELEIASNVVSWSEQIFRMFGTDRATTVPSYEAFQTFVHPEDLAGVVHRIDDAFRRGVAVELDHRIIRSDGAVRFVHSRNEVVLDAQDVPVRLIGTVQDVTEHHRADVALRESETRLLHSQKMEAVGRLAGGVAHDFNNLLTAILGYAQLATRLVEEGSQVRADLDEIRKAGERAGTLTRQLLAFSRRQILDPKQIVVRTVIRDLGPMLRLLVGEDIALCTPPEDDPARVFADRSQLEQVLMNLAVNARDAMPGGGILTLATQTIQLDPERASRLALPGGRYVELMVGDTGVGMTPEVLSHLFEPFFTTKEPGKGTGLGLATVYGIVQQSGGHVAVESQVGLGTRFRILLPYSDLTIDPTAAETLDRGLRGDETVLLVEDEAQVREVTRRMLEIAGYRVLEAANGMEAMKVASSCTDVIHLMVTDVMMPGLNGREVADRITSDRPAMRVLYVSGYTDDAIVLRTVLRAGAPFVHKPFTQETLTRQVREVLDRRS